MNDFSLWAQAARQFPNMAVLVLDTTGVHPDADIIRILVATTSGTIYDQLLWSARHQTANDAYTGLHLDMVAGGHTLSEEWEHIRATLSQHFVLAYNLDFVQERLNENARHYGLSPFALIGECLQEAAIQYFRGSYNLKLAEACKRIGHSMPTPPMAQDRAVGQLALLRAMAEGVGDTTTDHPF